MKRLIGFIIICSVLVIGAKSTGNKQLSEVNQIQGYYIFVDSKPTTEYEYLGTVKVTLWEINSYEYQSVRDAIIKKARKKFPNGDGLIFNFNNNGPDPADVIKFKE